MVRLFTALQNQGQASPFAGVADAFKAHEDAQRMDEELRQQAEKQKHSMEMDEVSVGLAKEGLEIRRETLNESRRSNQAREELAGEELAQKGTKTAKATQAAEDNLAIAIEANDRAVAALQSHVLSLGAAKQPSKDDLKKWAVPLREALETVRNSTPGTFVMAQKAFEAALAQAQLNVKNAIPVRALESATDDRNATAEMFGPDGKYKHLQVPERELNAIVADTTDMDDLAEQKKELDALALDYGNFRAYEDLIAQAMGFTDAEGNKQGGHRAMEKWDELYGGFVAWEKTKGDDDSISYTQKEFIKNASIWNDAQKPIAERNEAAQNMIGYAGAKGPQGDVISNQGRTIDMMTKEKEANATAAIAMRSLNRGVSGLEFTLGGDQSELVLAHIADPVDPNDLLQDRMREVAQLFIDSKKEVEKGAIGEQAAEQRWAYLQREAGPRGIDLEEFGAYIRQVYEDPEFQAQSAEFMAERDRRMEVLRRQREANDDKTGLDSPWSGASPWGGS